MRIRKIIILGGHIQALGLARQAKEEGLYVSIVAKDKWSVSRFSNTVDKFVVCRNNDELKSYLRQAATNDTLLFPTSDEYIELIYNNYLELSELMVLGVPDPECIRIFGDKRQTYKFCERNAISHPSSKYPVDLEDVSKMADDLNYPVVLKPAVMYSFHEKFGKKAFLCLCKADLISKCNMIQKNGFPLSGIIIQEFLDGGAPCLYSYGVYAEKGEPKAWIQANRIRQNPMDFGNSTTFAISCNIPQIEESARKILSLINYSGLAEVEFMYDSKSDEYKFLEINTRAWKWHTLSLAYNFGFLSEYIRALNQLPSNFNSHINFEKKAWVERLTDFSIIMKESLKGKMNLFSAFGKYKIQKESAAFAIKDPLPAIMYILMSPILFFKRY